MEELFYDTWYLEVIAKKADYQQRFIISGSASQNGIYSGTVGTKIPSLAGVPGMPWKLSIEWYDAASATWKPSVMRTVSGYSMNEGLTKKIFSDDATAAIRDNDFNDLVIYCRNLDPALAPYAGQENPYDFSYPKKSKRKPIRKKRPVPQK